MIKINQAVGERNHLDKYRGSKRLVSHFTKHKYCNCIGSVLLEVTYGMKEQHIWGETKKSVSKNGQTPINRNVCGKTYP